MSIPREFSLDTRREVIVGLTMHLGHDRAAPAPEGGGAPEKKVVRMTLRHRDERGMEHEVNEWSEQELYGKGIDVETITRGIELSACRDAAYQFHGECIYVLAFHGKDHPNRSRFLFKIPAGQEVQHIAQSSNGYGSSQKSEASIAERLMPDILRYVQAKEETLEKARNQFTESILKSNQQYASVITEYTDREGKIRQIELNADDHIYERERKRREDEENAQMKRQMMGLIKENAPKLVPYVVAAVQRLSQGPQASRPMQRPSYAHPAAPGSDPNFDAWYAQQHRSAEYGAQHQSAEYGESAGASPGGGGASVSAASQAWYGSGAPARVRVSAVEVPASSPGAASPAAASAKGVAPEKEAVADEHRDAGAGSRGEDPDALDKIKLRVAFDTARFVMLARGRNQLDAIRSSLSDEQKLIFEKVIVSADSADLDSEEGVSKAAGLALAFGASVQSDPASGFRLLGAIDNMTKLALIELSNLLKIYHEAMIGASA